MQLRHDIRSLSRNFQIFADFQSAEPYGTGHINDTYAATYRQGGSDDPLYPSADQPEHLQERRGADGEHPARDRSPPRQAGRPARRHAAGAHAGAGLRRADVLHRSPGRMLADLRLHRGRPDLRRRGIDEAGLRGGQGLRAVPGPVGRPARPAIARHDSRFPQHAQAFCRLGEGHRGRRGQSSRSWPGPKSTSPCAASRSPRGWSICRRRAFCRSGRRTTTRSSTT